MKIAHPPIRLLVYGFCLAAGLYNCKTKDVASLTPFTYTFKGLDDIKLPTQPITAPASVTVTPATITVPALTTAVSSGLASIGTSGPVPAAVQQAAAATGTAVSDAKAAEMVAAFTPAVITTLTTTGQLPASLKADVAAIAANPAMQAYMPKFTLPTVNGKAVSGRVGALTGTAASTPIVSNAVQDDACRDAATAAFNAAKAGLDASLQTQTAAITAAYTATAAAAAAEVATCQTGVVNTFTPMLTGAQATLNANIASLNAARSILGEANYNLLSVLNFVAYAQVIAAIATTQGASSTACTLTRDAKVAAAAVARDANLAGLTASYAATLATATTLRDQAIAGCHNQGNGG